MKSRMWLVLLVTAATGVMPMWAEREPSLKLFALKVPPSAASATSPTIWSAIRAMQTRAMAAVPPRTSVFTPRREVMDARPPPRPRPIAANSSTGIAQAIPVAGSARGAHVRDSTREWLLPLRFISAIRRVCSLAPNDESRSCLLSDVA